MSSKVQESVYLKDKGNQCFKQKDYKKAAELYSKAIDCYSSDAALFSNRAQCYLKLNRSADAKADCDAALALDGTYVKARYRRATALCNLGALYEARSDLAAVIKLDPSNAVATNDLKHLNDRLQSDETVRIFRCKRNDNSTLTRIPIEVSNAAETADKRACAGAENTAPQGVPNYDDVPAEPDSWFQFITDWRSLRQSPSAFGSYFLQISPQRYESLFLEALDSDLLLDCLTALPLVDRSQYTASAIAERLLTLSSLPRFSLALAMLSPEDTTTLNAGLVSVCRELPPDVSNRIKAVYDFNVVF